MMERKVDPKTGKYSSTNLVLSEFDAKLPEMKGLPVQDREELATAIARMHGIKEEECNFAFRPY